MIINFSIKNFRSIKEEITLSFEPERIDHLEEYYIAKLTDKIKVLKLGLIFGPNASGKTNILEALNFLRALVLEPFEIKTIQFDYQPFLFDDKFEKGNSKFTLEFVQNNIKYYFVLEFNKRSITNEKLYYFNPKKALIYERVTDLRNQVSKIQFGTKIRLDSKDAEALIRNTLWNNTVLGGYLKTNFYLKELQDVIDWFQDVFTDLIRPKDNLKYYILSMIDEGKIKKSKLLKILNKADFAITDIIIKEKSANLPEVVYLMDNKLEFSQIKNIVTKKIDEDKFAIKEIFLQHSVNGINYILPYTEESAGTKRYYEMGGLLSLLIENDKVLLIDELEASLHPDLVKHFLLSFLVNSKNSQIIATTHSRELLMEKDILRKDVIWFTDKKDDCSTDLFSLADFPTTLIRKENSIYNFYKIGKLGAVPKLSDYFLDL
ncbi:MAG: ATP-binding protein [Calditrichia bacterium]